MSLFKESQQIWGLAIRIVGLLFSIWLLARVVDLESIMSVWSQLPIWIFVLALILAFIRIWLSSERWMLLSPNATGMGHWSHFRMLLATGAVNLFLPGLVGSDLIRSVLVAREAKSNVLGAVVSIYLDRVVGFLGLLIMGLTAAMFSPSLPGRWLYFSAFSILGLISLLTIWISQNQQLLNRVLCFFDSLLLRKTWLQKVVKKPFDALGQCRPSRNRLLFAVLICFPIHGLWFIIVWLVAATIGIQISFFSLAIVTTLTWILTIFPITFGGIGVRELSFVYLLGLEGVSVDQATLLGLFQSLIVLVTSATGLPVLWKMKSTTMT